MSSGTILLSKITLKLFINSKIFEGGLWDRFWCTLPLYLLSGKNADVAEISPLRNWVLSTTGMNGLSFLYSDDVICINNPGTTLRKLDLLKQDIWFDFESFSSVHFLPSSTVICISNKVRFLEKRMWLDFNNIWFHFHFPLSSHTLSPFLNCDTINNKVRFPGKRMCRHRHYKY